MVVKEEAAQRARAALVAAGREHADRVLRGGRVVNVHTGLIGRADVAIAGTRIAAVGDVEHTVGPQTEIVDCTGTYVLPGFIDSHVHLGGSQLAVQPLAEVLLPHGTVAVCTDFYEISTIGGLPAVLGELEAAESSGLSILLSPFVAAVLGIGAFGNLERFSYHDLEQLLDHPACVELREWNCWADWLPLEGQQRVYEAALRKGLAIGGHLEGLSGPLLQASVALGVVSEHEAVSADEALERLSLGVNVQIRGGSAARDFEQLVPAITERGASPDQFSFCTDEQELASMAHHGHIDRLVRQAVKDGVAPVDAIRMATLNAARTIGVDRDYGSVTPGRYASLVTVDDLAGFRVRRVLSHGQLAAEDGRYLLTPEPHEYPASARATVDVREPVTHDDFRLDVADGTHELRVIGMTPGKLMTEALTRRLDVQDGRLVDGGAGLAKIAVFDRHLGGAERFVGLISGYDIARGAVAATVNPGMMNLLTVGVDEGDMVIAASRVVELGGGIVVAAGGRVVAEVALPLYGIVSDEPSAEVVDACNRVEEAIENDMGCTFDGLLSSAGFACLAVSIPSLKVTSRGLAMVSRSEGGKPVDLVVEG